MTPVRIKLPGGWLVIRLWPTLTSILMIAVMLGLGSWQIERLRWKEGLIATIQAQLRQAPVDVRSLDLDAGDYRPATASGTFTDKVFYLAATSLTGNGGYHVLQPLRLDDGGFLLVDRGWIPYDRKNKADGFDRPQGRVSLHGILHHPQHSWAQPANHPATNDWYWIDLPAMAQQAGIPDFRPIIFDADATPNPGGYPLGGQTRLELPNNHLQYALTWYGLAVVLTIIFIIFSFQKSPKV